MRKIVRTLQHRISLWVLVIVYFTFLLFCKITTTITKAREVKRNRVKGESVIGIEMEFVSVIVTIQFELLIDVLGTSFISLSVSPTCVTAIVYVPVFAVSGMVNLIVNIVPGEVGLAVGPIWAIARKMVPFLESILLTPVIGLLPRNPPTSTLVRKMAEGSVFMWISPALIP